MNKSYVKKGLVFAVILLFISVSVIPSTVTTEVKQITMPTAKGDTLYVGGSGSGNYTKIQDAIDNASDGDTVFVYNGTYYEFNIAIKKSISLIGENKTITIIDANLSRNAIKIFDGANGVTVSGFTIQNTEKPNGKGVEIYSDNNIIKDNTINNNSDGITIYGDSNTISSNIISNNIVSGVAIEEYTKYNIVTKNRIINNGHYEGMGVICIDSLFNIVNRNDILYNSIGVHFVSSFGNIIKENNFIGNNKSAYFELSFFNRWIRNYWDDLNGARFKVIKGRFEFVFSPDYCIDFPWLDFDWHPAQEPYDI